MPASSGAEVGGDWFDVIPLAGGRVAFVVGDVMGHGLGAAATMGRLRTAVRTLAGLDMAPDELLRRVNDLGDDLAQSQTEGWMATAVYAVYDPSTRRCADRPGRPSAAGAGRAPRTTPPGARRGCSTCPPGCRWASAGCGSRPPSWTCRTARSWCSTPTAWSRPAAWTSATGIDRLREMLCRPVDSLEDACDELLSAMEPGREPDDVALLMARLGGLPDGSTAGVDLPRRGQRRTAGAPQGP